MKKKVIYPFTLFKVLTQIWRLFVLLPALLLSLPALAQKFPATVNTTMGRPHSVYLNDYTALGSDKLVANLVFNDFNEASWNVRLRITIESTSLRIQTRPDFVPATPITLTPGVAVQLAGSDLAPYLDLPNITISGGGQNGDARASLGQNFRLPEGAYTFCVEVLDYRSGVPISNKSCQTAFLFLNDEPTTVLPMCGAVVRPTNPQNIVFQWQQSNSNSPNNMLGTEYQFTLYEVTDLSVNPLNAINNGKALKVFESDWSNRRNFVYDATAPLLDKGKRYVYRVQARDVDGKDIFKNNGLSQVCWFSYGYPLNGVVALTFPENKGFFSLRDQPVFRWKAPENRMPGQPVSYHFRMVKIGLSESVEAAMRTNPVWYEETTPPMVGNNGWELSLPRSLDKQASYAWQVTAFSDDQLVAQSEVRRFTGPPLIEQFRAGEHTVVVQSTSNTNMNKLSGTGKVKVSEDGTMQTVAFKDLKLVGNSELWLLEEGEIAQPLDSFPKIELGPAAAENGSAYFYPQVLLLNKDRLALKGTVTWALPHPVAASATPQIKTAVTAINFDKLKLNGNAMLDESNDFNLLEPMHFRLKLLTSSDVNIINNQYTLRLNGECHLPENVKGVNGQRVFVPFVQANQLYYLRLSNLSLENNIALLKNTGMVLQPTSVVIDLSEGESPLKLAVDKSWKGVYLEKFNLIYRQAVDRSRQLILAGDITQSFSLETSNEYQSWVTATGLHYVVSRTFADSDRGLFNQFGSQLLSIKVNIRDNVISDSHFKGNIRIPFISATRTFAYTIPLSEEGFNEGYLDQSLEGNQFVFNEPSDEQKLNITIRRAVFADRERMDMTLDIQWPYLEAQMRTVDGLKVWGNGRIGFGHPDGIASLTTQVNGKAGGYPIIITNVGFGYVEKSYVFKAVSHIDMADDLSGKEGPPVAGFYSIAANVAAPTTAMIYPTATTSGTTSTPADEKTDADRMLEALEGTPTNTNSYERPADATLNLNVGIAAFSNVRTLHVDSTYIKFDGLVAAFEGYAKFTKDDPVWGNSYTLFCKANLNLPAMLQLDATFVNGRVNGYGYWLMDVGFGLPGAGGADKDRMKSGMVSSAKYDALQSPKSSGKVAKFKSFASNGIALGNSGLSLIGIEGRVYHHMNHNTPNTVTGAEFSIDYVPMQSTKYGAFLRLSFMDTYSKGVILYLDGAAEVAVHDNKGFNIGIEAKAKIGNLYAIGGGETFFIANTSVATAVGTLTYNSPDEHFIGNFNFSTETPLLCGRGKLLIDIRKRNFSISLGTREEKVYYKPGCFGWSPTGWLAINRDSSSNYQTKANLGLGLQFSAEFQSPTIDIKVGKFKPYAGMGIAAGILASCQFEPKFAMIEAGLWVDGFAKISCDYELGPCPACKKGTYVLAAAQLSGNLKINFPNEMDKSTRLKGDFNAVLYIPALKVKEKCTFKLPSTKI